MTISATVHPKAALCAVPDKGIVSFTTLPSTKWAIPFWIIFTWKLCPMAKSSATRTSMRHRLRSYRGRQKNWKL